ncbi:metalloprotease, putative [Babesia ovis]|uniref:Metalloprotease, putative n=1 Tax=Babesia ovis TaxID=5869 RepID=A0A9W5TA82_BABOV|nr:metalloprotease, putative [Babesia ovis]
MCPELIDLESTNDEEEFEIVDVHEAFRHFNEICFDQTLDAVVVSWSRRLTLSAGRCRFKVPLNQQNVIVCQGNQYCEITLSEPILKYRSAKECKETLLHEMIHAYLFLTKTYKNVKAHGKEFLWHMHRVNDITGLNVTIHHNFHEEVAYHRRHVWRCSGPCRTHPPYFGYLRRARNMAPGPRDRWWNNHKAFCGGTFVKVSGSSTAGTTRPPPKASSR